jgi:hypothetical protein
MLTFDYPIYFLAFCVATGVAYATLMYFRERAFNEVSVWWRRLLYALRFLATSILVFLLLSPLLRTNETQSQKPIIVVANDASESVGAGMRTTDSLALHKGLRTLTEQLGDNYDVKTYSFGERVRDGFDFKYTDKVSNIDDALTQIYDTYTNQNLGAVILTTDGIYNQGANPLYNAQKLAVPIYTIAVGDTVPKRDAVVKRVYNNQIAYLGDQFTVQVDVAAKNCAGSSTTLSVSKLGAGTLKSQAIGIDNNDFFKTIDFTINADAVGVQRYKISLAQVNGEHTVANNVKEVVIEVIDARQKVLLLANAPHPDLAAIKQAVTNNKNYEIEIQYIADFKGDAAKYDLVIFHALPGSNGDAKSALSQVASAKKPQWFILGNQSNLGQFSLAQSVLRVSGSVTSTNEVQPVAAPNFQQFNPNTNFLAQLNKMPPMVAPFGEYTPDPTAHILFQQKIGTVTTKYPLWLFGEKTGVKTAVLAAEGLWKWRITDFLLNKNFNNVDEIITQTVQYLTVKDDKRKFRAFTNKTVYDENENIVIDAELYNDAYQRINEPDAKVIVSDSKGKDYAFTFSRVSNYYSINAGLLPVGDYTYKANTAYNSASLAASGQFSIQPIQLEIFETTADHRLLRTMSAQSGAATLPPTAIQKLVEMIKAKSTVKPLLYTTLRTRSLIELKWLCFLILGLLFGEWFLRKYHGGY